MIKLDLRKELKAFYAPSAKKVEALEVPPFQFAMIDGAIEPGSEPGLSPAFKDALQALYGVSYTLKFMVKQRKEDPVDYPVMALEALWWIEDGEFSLARKDNWCWRAMILQPDLITPAMFDDAIAQLRKKRGDAPAWACCAWSASPRGWSCRRSTSAPTPPSQPPWPRWTPLPRPTAIASVACTMRSTWAIPCAPIRRN